MVVSDICLYNSVPSLTIDSFKAVLAWEISIIHEFTLIMYGAVANGVTRSNGDAKLRTHPLLKTKVSHDGASFQISFIRTRGRCGF